MFFGVAESAALLVLFVNRANVFEPNSMGWSLFILWDNNFILLFSA